MMFWRKKKEEKELEPIKYYVFTESGPLCGRLSEIKKAEISYEEFMEVINTRKEWQKETKENE